MPETALVEIPQSPVQIVKFNDEQIEIIKRTICKDATDEELNFFLQVCMRRRLDPFAQQIYAIKRPDNEGGGSTMGIQISIGGLRLQAERSRKYQGQTPAEWCDRTGKWTQVWLSKDPPAAARSGVYRSDFKEPLFAVCVFDEFCQRFKRNGVEQLTRMWRKMPSNQISKCFTPDTQVLTDRGFQRFDSVTGRILQVTDEGLEPTDAIPFVQDYDGPMISSRADMLNFSVTPDHDMITTIGRAEARAIYETSRYRAVWFIPLTIEPSRPDWNGMADQDLILAAAMAADGWFHQSVWQCGVSKQHKVERLRALEPVSTGVVHSRGAVAVTAEIRSNFDKIRFTFPGYRTSPLLGSDKTFAPSILHVLSKRQARLVLDTWQACVGYTNKKTNVRRIFTSRPDHVAAIEVLAVAAGYSVNVPKPRMSDISTVPNFYMTISEPAPIGIIRPVGTCPGIIIDRNESGNVWCVTVPSGKIVVRRNGFSMLCGNCSEAAALRKAFPEECGELYVPEELHGRGETIEEKPKPRLTPEFIEMLEGFAALKKTVGHELYYRILNKYEYKHSNEIGSVERARQIYREILSIHRAETAAHPAPAAEAPPPEQPGQQPEAAATAEAPQQPEEKPEPEHTISNDDDKDEWGDNRD